MKKYGLFEVCGIEVEYMVADKETLEIMPISDFMLDRLVEMNNGGDPLTGSVEWSHELVAHVAEAKCASPVPSVGAELEPWNAALKTVNGILAEKGACLLPSAAHPWMNPASAVLWQHEDREIYEQYDRIFGCNTHGWTNLQSVHINLPFADDEEFGRLHAAIRVAMPLIPALAASSPYLDGKFTGCMDARMVEYTRNSLRVPSMTGPLIPEPIFTREEYEEKIFKTIFKETAPFDPDGILNGEWANARGAIARFDRGAVEIRVMDSQESPQADLGAVFAVTALVKLIAEERFASIDSLKTWSAEKLRGLFFAAVKGAETASVPDPDYTALFGITGNSGVSFGGIWKRLFELPEFNSGVFGRYFENYLRHGSLAARFFRRAGADPDRKALESFMRELRDVNGLLLS